MNELSLFTGAGGGLLGTHLLGWKPCGYVEWNEYCQRVIAARIRDGIFPVAPIFGDVREFVQSGAAEQYRGIADVVSAGFPCQPFSVAGNQLGENDERNMWPATADVIRVVQPESVLLENVRGLISAGYLGTVIGNLADMGYVGRWGVIRASDVGAPHQRARLWIVAHADSELRKRRESFAKQTRLGEYSNRSQDLADSIIERQPEARELCERSQERITSCGEILANASSGRCSESNGGEIQKPGRTETVGRGENLAHAHAARRQEQHAAAESDRSGSSSRRAVSWWLRDPADAIESGVGRVAYGVADRVDRLTALGNGQVSEVARTAWETLR